MLRCVSLEEQFFRPLAVLSKLLPDVTTNYLEMTEAEQLQCIAASPAQTELLGNAFYSKSNGDLVVSGTQNELFPHSAANPPRHKYAALFDPRPCFDAIRSAFLRPTLQEAQSRSHLMFELLDQMRHVGAQQSLDKGEELAARLMEDEKEVSVPPQDFLRFAIPAYLHAVQQRSWAY